MMKKYISTILATFIITFAFGQLENAKLITANDSYTKGNFEQAINDYEAVIEAGKESAELYYNLGNAYFKIKNLPAAILNYERAYLLSPEDEDIIYNLELSRTLVVDKIERIPEFFLTKWKKQIAGWFSIDGWGYLSISLFLLCLISLSFYLFSYSVFLKKLNFGLGILFFAGSVLGFSYGRSQLNIKENHNTAIIFSPSVTVRSSPDESGSELFYLHEGTKVHVEDELGDWREVKIEDGKVFVKIVEKELNW